MIKSVIEEASSLEKAIELGWIKAGKPKEFSVKIFQEPVKNFLGISKQTAKIGLFFKDAVPAGSENQGYRSHQGRRPYRSNQQRGGQYRNQSGQSHPNRREQGSRPHGQQTRPTGQHAPHTEASENQAEQHLNAVNQAPQANQQTQSHHQTGEQTERRPNRRRYRSRYPRREQQTTGELQNSAPEQPAAGSHDGDDHGLD